jgi:hypothetical protein
LYYRAKGGLVILNAVKNLVLYRDVALFLWEKVPRRKGLLGCFSTRFFATLRMTKGERVLCANPFASTHQP